MLNAHRDFLFHKPRMLQARGHTRTVEFGRKAANDNSCACDITRFLSTATHQAQSAVRKSGSGSLASA